MLLFFKGVDYLRTKKTTLTELPDPDNQAQVTRYYLKCAEALKDPDWPEEILQAAEFLLERVEASPEVLELYFKDCWLPALRKAEAEVLEVLLEISCVNPKSAALQPTEELMTLCLELLGGDLQPHNKLSALKLLSVLPKTESVLTAVIKCLQDPTDFVRTGKD
jgi:hypothetical protein